MCDIIRKNSVTKGEGVVPLDAKRRGVTLAELCVTLAVVAVAAVMAVSLSLIISNRVKVSIAKNEAQNDVRMIENTLTDWMDNVVGNGAIIAEIKSNSLLSADIEGESYTLSFSEGNLFGNLPGGKSISIYTERVKSVSFSALSRQNYSDVIVFCTVDYIIPQIGSDNALEASYTFCCNPHISDIIEGGAADD